MGVLLLLRTGSQASFLAKTKTATQMSMVWCRGPGRQNRDTKPWTFVLPYIICLVLQMRRLLLRGSTAVRDGTK